MHFFKSIVMCLLFSLNCAAFQSVHLGNSDLSISSQMKLRYDIGIRSTIQDDVEAAALTSAYSDASSRSKTSVQSPPQNFVAIRTTDHGRSVIVRKASQEDYLKVAELRLSVFSLLNPLLQQRFIARSIQFMRERRRMGAVCLIASAAEDCLLSDYTYLEPDGMDAADIGVLGTLECSFHEFENTAMSCPSGQLETRCYITEVAVRSECRRMGIGRVLMDAAEVWAASQGFNQLYLHVNDLNTSALGLYSKSGYKPVNAACHRDFTKSLGLGSRKQGQRHTLLMKQVQVPVSQ